MTFPIEIECASADDAQNWVESTVCGVRAMSRARKCEAARCWLTADAARHTESAFDPMFAAGRSNAGLANILLGRLAEAERCLSGAERAWRRTIDQIAVLDVPMTGASSAFHFRLATNVPEALTGARRDRYRHLAEAALTITRFNHLFVAPPKFRSSLVGAHARELKPKLDDIFGAASAEARLLAASAEPAGCASVAAIYADKQTDVSGRRQTFAAALSNECAQLESAVALTLMLALPMFDASDRPSEGKTNNTDFAPTA